MRPTRKICKGWYLARRLLRQVVATGGMKERSVREDRREKTPDKTILARGPPHDAPALDRRLRRGTTSSTEHGTSSTSKQDHETSSKENMIIISFHDADDDLFAFASSWTLLKLVRARQRRPLLARRTSEFVKKKNERTEEKNRLTG